MPWASPSAAAFSYHLSASARSCAERLAFSRSARRIDHPFHIAQCGGLLKPLACFGKILRTTKAILVQHSDVIHRSGVAERHRLLIPPTGFPIVLSNALAGSIESADIGDRVELPRAAAFSYQLRASR